MELDIGSAVSKVPIARFWCLFLRHKILLADVQLRIEMSEKFRPEDFFKVHATYEKKN